MNRRSAFVGAIAVALLGSVLTAGAAQSADVKPMGPRLLQQMVLRVQMPTGLGTWQQYLYQTEKGQAPGVCATRTGKVASLPKSLNSGFVNYQVNQGTSGVVTVYQYKNAAAARTALRALRNISCPDSPKVPTESQKLVDADQGSDFTDASRTGVVVGLTYAGDGFTQQSRRVTQRGLAVIVTEVTVITASTPSEADAETSANAISALNKDWHEQVVAAYNSFGVRGIAS
jgi:hypothetical protein